MMEWEAFVAMTADRPWRWGVQDCTIWVADWCVARWGIDPAAAWRGRYDSEAEAEAAIAEAGGLAALVGPTLGFLDARDPRDAQPGDVGIIRAAGREVAAICTGQMWAFRTPAGIGEARCTALRVWGR